MSTLLLRLAAPLQAWGAGAKFDQRETQRLPTKSGVVGLLAAALGRRRWESIEDLEALKMGVRADQAGEMLRDYHTAKREQHTYITQRYYIADAVFVVGLEGEEGLLSRLAEAVENPAFPLFLGRRSCPPQGKILINLLIKRKTQKHPTFRCFWKRLPERPGRSTCGTRLCPIIRPGVSMALEDSG